MRIDFSVSLLIRKIFCTAHV
jgi:hypothetical protein